MFFQHVKQNSLTYKNQGFRRFFKKNFHYNQKNALTDAAEYDRMKQSIDEEKYLTAFTFRERKTVRPPQQNRRE